MNFIRYFMSIVAGALLSSVIGGLFASVVAVISPEFVKGLFSPAAGANVVRYAAVVGFSLLLVTILRVAQIFKKKADEKSEA